MEKPRITTVDGVNHEMKKITGRAYRVVAEFMKSAPILTDVDFIERNAEFVAEFFDDVTKDDVLDMPLEEIIPAALSIRDTVVQLTWSKTAEISKNFEADKEL